MRVNTKQAVRLFFQNPSLEQVFKEAVANSLDANATDIIVDVFIDSFEKQETLQLTITDNGEGFTEKRYDKFCELLNVDEDTHKGVGRLVYLSYFDTIEIDSVFEEKHRKFTFNDTFDKDKTDMTIVPDKASPQETKIIFKDCSLLRLSSYAVITPDYLKRQILQEFFPRFYLMRKEGRDFSISFNIEIAHKNKKHLIGSYHTEISKDDVPDMLNVPITSDSLDLFANTSMDYVAEKVDGFKETFLMTALCVDNRTKVLDDIIAPENLPSNGCRFIFILHSSYFKGKVDPARQVLTLSDQELKTIKALFREKVAEVIEKDIPSIKERNQKTKESLFKTYPHLVGYFTEGEVGIVNRSKSIEDAQKNFMKAQKDILEASNLDGDKYDKALDVSSRTLAQYILYREKIIEKVAAYTAENSEADLHNLILPKRTIMENGDVDGVYTNNLWLLDNKYMTYTTAMSERTMKEVLDEISLKANTIEDDGRPDIAIIFSDDPTKTNDSMLDVVIIELKKRGITLAKTEEVESQLQQRAVKLLNYYPNRIQRMWFYGIVEFNDTFKLSLKNDKYTPLYSKDSLYYKENEWYKSLEDETKYKVGTYILSIDAFIKDAKAHNEVFLNILKEGFKQSTPR